MTKTSRRIQPDPAPPRVVTKSAERTVKSSRSNVRDILRTRLRKEVDRIVEQADEQAVARAAAAASDAGALAQALSDTVANTALTEVDPLAALTAKGAQAKLELMKRAGGLLSVTEVAQRLGITRQAVDKRRRERKLLAVPRRGSDYGYPACQFDETEVVPGLEPLLLPIASFPWLALEFLITPSDMLTDRTPLEVLRSGDLSAQVTALRMARIAGEGEGFG